MEVSARILRKMGYRSDSQGIIDRYIRVNGDWDGHLQQTRAFILNAVSGKMISNLAVLGSGWCLDLPLDELAGIADQIQLYDLVHPPQVLHQLLRFSNVAAIRADVTGGAVINAYNAIREYRKQGVKVPVDNICGQSFEPAVAPDYTVSLNLYSQLADLISGYLKLYAPYTAQELDRLAYLLQQSHLQLLTPGKSCLITDVRELRVDLDTLQEEAESVIRHPLPQAKRAEAWAWDFEEEGNYRPGKKTILNVVALEL
jgi:hypothetical protein